MSEQEQLTKLAKDLRLIKTWWPIVTGFCLVIAFFMGLQSLYDNKVAKKEDTDKMAVQLIEISKQISDLTIKINYKVGNNDIVFQKIDSLAKVVKRMRQFKYTANSSQQVAKFVIGVKKHGPNGPITFEPVNNN